MTRKHILKMKWAWSRHIVMHTRGHLLAILKRDMAMMSGMISASVRPNNIVCQSIPIRVSFTV